METLVFSNESFATGPVDFVFEKDAIQSLPHTPYDDTNCAFSISPVETVTRSEARVFADDSDVTDINISKEVVGSMGFPEYLVQLAIDIQRLDHGTDFANATQLFTAVEDLCGNQRKQEDAVMRLYHTQQAQREAEKKRTEDTDQARENEAWYSNAYNIDPPAEPLILVQVEPKKLPVTKAELLERVKKLSQENLELRQRKLCRACKKVDLASSGVTFLPCGHFLTCEKCSNDLTIALLVAKLLWALCALSCHKFCQV